MLHSKFLMLTTAAALLLMSGVTAAEREASVTASGTGSAEAVPDIALLRFGVTARQPTVAEGRDEVARGVARLIALARDTGLEDDDISTAALSVRPDLEFDPETRNSRLVGYVVSRQVSLKLKDIGRLGELTEQALSLGVTEASPASFDSSRRDELETEALAAAARDARRRAEVMAQALGVRLGPPLQIQAGGVAGPPGPMLMRSAMAESDGMSGAETYQPGLISISAGVTASFTLLVP